VPLPKLLCLFQNCCISTKLLCLFQNCCTSSRIVVSLPKLLCCSVYCLFCIVLCIVCV
jgi:hypothetical protein